MTHELSSTARAVMDAATFATIVSSSKDGTPNASFISRVYYVDERHVALSFQFFNKTHRNVRENPRVAALLYDMAGCAYWRLDLRYHHSETEGDVFDELDMQIEAIASMTGMSGVFKLKAADVYEVVACDRIEPA